MSAGAARWAAPSVPAKNQDKLTSHEHLKINIKKLQVASSTLSMQPGEISTLFQNLLKSESLNNAQQYQKHSLLNDKLVP